MHIRVAAVALLVLSPLALHAALDPKDARAQYEQSQKWQFATTAAPVPANGITITRDTATWTLQSGSIRLMQPLANGAVTGLVFEGQGRFRMTIPDRFELAQLRRFAQKPMTEIDQPFTQLVLRVSDDTIDKLGGASTKATAYGPYSLAEKRHELWLTDHFIDADARVIAAMLNPSALQIVADMKTADLDWLTYDYDSGRGEEIQLARNLSSFSESWISLDRPEDRRPDGRPGAPQPSAVAIEHFDVKADLTRWGRTGEVGSSRQRTINGHYVIEATIAPLGDGANAIVLDVPSRAKELSIREGTGALAFFRDEIGKRSASIENEVHDDDVTIILGTPLKRGEKRRLVFEYDLELPNYAPGGYWYPTVPDSFGQKFTARLELTVMKKNEVRSMGRMESRREESDREVSVWVIDRPTKMITFSSAQRFEEVRLEVPNIPPVLSFGPVFQMDSHRKTRNVGADVANSLQWFQNMLQDKLPDTKEFYVTSIAAGHGQAFDGFLHMTEWTYTGEHPGASELFRAHEVAHEWWGHKVGWKSYRDQWLSEAFAEYSAMMFVEGFVKGGDKFFEEMLDSYEGIVLGDLRGGFSKFSRPWLIEFNPSHRARLGPIGHGYRAGTRDVPAGYQIQAYYKGPLVLHMLRMMLRYKTSSDDLFVEILRDFVHEYGGRQASTEDFRHTVEKKAPGDWNFFFDAWVNGAEIPSYRWSYSVAPADGGGLAITVNVKRSGVSPEFSTVIPVRIDYEDGRSGVLFIMSKSAEESVTRKIAAKPKNVVFAPDHALLANIRRE